MRSLTAMRNHRDLALVVGVLLDGGERGVVAGDLDRVRLMQPWVGAGEVHPRRHGMRVGEGGTVGVGVGSGAGPVGCDLQRVHVVAWKLSCVSPVRLYDQRPCLVAVWLNVADE